MLLLIEMDEQSEDVLPVVMAVVEAFQHLAGPFVLSHVDECVGQRLLVSDITRFQCCCPLDGCQSLVLLLEDGIILCKVIVGLRLGGIDFNATAQQVEGSIVVALHTLANGLQEHGIVTVRILRTANEK